MEILEGSHLGIWDIVVIVLYFAFVIAVGIWSSRKNKNGSVSSYFLASRNMHWIPVGVSLFASCIGSGHFIGLSGSGASSGIAVAGFEIGAVFILLMLGYLFAPVYLSSGVYTMPEYLRERFGGQRIRVYLAFLSLILYIFTKISADLYAGALFIQMTLNKNSPEWLYISILILLGVAALFTIAGGLTAVIWTDFVQTILMIFGAFILMGITFSEVGGFNSLMTKFPYAIAEKRTTNDSCGEPPKDYRSLFRTIAPGESDYPWTGIVFGLTINALWYWCTDQVIVQRTLASKNLSHAKGGCILASYIKLLPLWILILPGMAARVLFPDRIGCTDPEECKAICGSPGGCTNIAYVELVLRLLPTGLTGLMLAVMMAALMSSLTSIFNSSSTIFTIDIWKRFRNNATDMELLIVGRASVLVLVVISIIWIPVIQNSGNSKLFDYIQSITAFLAPSICAVFLLAIFWSRINEPGAFWGLMLGLIVGMIRFVLEFSFPPPACGSVEEDLRPSFIKTSVDNIHYLHFSCLLFLFTGIISIAVSMVTKPIPEECLYRLTFWSRHRTEVRRSIDLMENDKSENEANKKMSNSAIEKVSPMDIEENERNELNPSGILKFIYRICGATKSKNEEECTAQLPHKSEEQKAIDAAEFLKEDPKWKLFVDINALLCLVITVFICGFFA